MAESVDTTNRSEKITRPFYNIGLTALMTLFLLPSTTSVSPQLSGVAVLIGAVSAGILASATRGFTKPLRGSMETKNILLFLGALPVSVFAVIFLSDTQIAASIHGGLGFMWAGSIYSLFSYYVRK